MNQLIRELAILAHRADPVAAREALKDAKARGCPANDIDDALTRLDTLEAHGGLQQALKG